MIAPAADQSHARQAFDNWCCRRDPHDPHSAVRPNGRALLTPALPFEAPLSEASLARISGPGARRVGKFTVVVSTVWPPQIRADDGADCYGQTFLLVGPWSSAERRWVERSQ